MVQDLYLFVLLMLPFAGLFVLTWAVVISECFQPKVQFLIRSRQAYAVI